MRRARLLQVGGGGATGGFGGNRSMPAESRPHLGRASPPGVGVVWCTRPAEYAAADRRSASWSQFKMGAPNGNRGGRPFRGGGPAEITWDGAHLPAEGRWTHGSEQAMEEPLAIAASPRARSSRTNPKPVKKRRARRVTGGSSCPASLGRAGTAFHTPSAPIGGGPRGGSGRTQCGAPRPLRSGKTLRGNPARGRPWLRPVPDHLTQVDHQACRQYMSRGTRPCHWQGCRCRAVTRPQGLPDFRAVFRPLQVVVAIEGPMPRCVLPVPRETSKGARPSWPAGLTASRCDLLPWDMSARDTSKSWPSPPAPT